MKRWTVGGDSPLPHFLTLLRRDASGVDGDFRLSTDHLLPSNYTLLVNRRFRRRILQGMSRENVKTVVTGVVSTQIRRTVQ